MDKRLDVPRMILMGLLISCVTVMFCLLAGIVFIGYCPAQLFATLATMTGMITNAITTLCWYMDERKRLESDEEATFLIA